MNIKFLSPIAVSLLLLVGTSNVVAKGQPNPHQREVKRCDHEAHIAAEKLATQFKTVDSNGNGLLDQNETTAAQIAARCFRHLDRNNDGALSAVELQRIS